MRQETWSELDREIRAAAANALAAEGLHYAARELRIASPMRDEITALALCHLATQLGSDLRGELHARPRTLLMSVALAAYSVHRGLHSQGATYIATIRKLARAMTAPRPALQEAAS